MRKLPGNSSPADLSAGTGTPYSTLLETRHPAEEERMVRWPRVVEWGEYMHRIREILFISALVLGLAGCSGLSDVKSSGGGQATGVTVTPGTASLDLFTTQAFGA